jgi:hypothetical protein
MALDWLKLYHEARRDGKLETLTDAQHRVWFRGLVFASEQRDQRGTIPEMDARVLAIEIAGGDVALLDETLAVLSKLRIVTLTSHHVTPVSRDVTRDVFPEFMYVNFVRRNSGKPSDENDKVRARKAKSRAGSRNVTPCHALDKTRVDKNREDLTPPGGSRMREGLVGSEESSTTTDDDAVLEAEIVVEIPKAPPPSSKLVSAAAALDRRLSAPRLAQAWRFTADQQALINQAGEALGVPGDELAGKVGQSLAKAPMGQDDDGTYDAWFALDAGTVAQWLEAAVAIALRSANKSLPYVVGVVRSRLKSGTTAPPGTVVQFAQPSQPAVVPAPVPPELAERPWWAALVKVAKNPIAPSVIDVMNLAHALGLRDQDEAAAIKLQAEGAVAACDWLWANQPPQKVG